MHISSSKKILLLTLFILPGSMFGMLRKMNRLRKTSKFSRSFRRLTKPSVGLQRSMQRFLATRSVVKEKHNVRNKKKFMSHINHELKLSEKRLFIYKWLSYGGIGGMLSLMMVFPDQDILLYTALPSGIFGVLGASVFNYEEEKWQFLKLKKRLGY